MAQVYFFDQPILLKRKKRRRKLPDELPRSLRFANLPPTLAAFLSSQERQKLKQEGGEPGVDEFGGLLDFDDGDGRREFLPNLSNDAQVFRQLRHHGSEDSLSVDGEYSQKQHYHEAVSIAPTILVQLAAILYLFKNEHLDLPRELVNDLEGHYKHLITQVQYGKYKWQCTENILKELQEQSDALEAEEEGEDGEENEQNGKDVDKTDGDKVEKKKKRKKKLDAGGEGGGYGKEIFHSGASGSKAKSSKKSHSRLDAGAGNRRLSTFSQLRGDGSVIGDDISQGGIHQPNFLQIVSFSMSSKACEDKGWILPQEKDKSQEENAQRNILEVCLEKLKEALTQIKIDSGRYRELGHDKSLYSRYYGDTKKESMMKYVNKRTTTGKSPSFMMSKIMPPRMTPSTPDIGQTQLFFHSLNDSSATAFYPSGNLAAIVSRAGPRMPGGYTLIYEDDEDKTLLASFTPTGHGCCYHPNGSVKFLSTEKEGMLFDTEGAVTKKWDWMLPHLKLPSAVIVTINDQFTLRCYNRNHMTIVFTCRRESAKLHVGQVLTAVEPVTQEELGYLVTDEEFQSKSAEECVRPPPVSPKKKDKKPKSKHKHPHKPAFQISEIVKSLEMEEESEYIPAKRDLVRLSRKAKNICENWLDHYRIAVGIRSPHLNRVSSSIPHHRRRGIQSAKPTMDNSTSVPQEPGEDDPFTLPRTTGVIRSPSAPPVSSNQRRRLSILSNVSRHSRQRTSSPNRLKSAASSVERGGLRGGLPEKEDFDPSASTTGHRSPTAMSLKSGPLSASHPHTPHTAWSSSPTRTVTATPTPALNKRKSSSLTGCPVNHNYSALRAEMLGDTMATCRCSRHKVPSIGDLELERYLKECVPRTQLIVIAVVSALFPEALPCHEMFSKFYERQQRNRTKPCYQSRTDPYRLLVYDVVSAVHLSGHKQPLLLQRHNAVPGMFLIYAGGKLVFCDHIFNGYGNAKRDFQKQLLQSRQASSIGNFLPADFRFSPSRGRRGPRSAWGGEIGGTGVDRHASSGLPSLFTIHTLTNGSITGRRHTQSADTKNTSGSDPRNEQLNCKQGSTAKRHVNTTDFLSQSLNHANNLVALAL